MTGGAQYMKRVKQFQRTDADIIRAFIKLLGDKSIEKITVQDIIDEAMINRSTFYQHFPDKYAILECLQKQYIIELKELMKRINEQNQIDVEKIDSIMNEYFHKNKKMLKKLIYIKTEHVDMQAHFKAIFVEFFKDNSFSFSDLEAQMMAGMYIDFFLYNLEQEDITNYSMLLFQSFLHIVEKFFRIEENESAKRQLLTLIYESSHS